jgi:ABC-type dipeptide/oligopeptide/nickel transport system permease subunit
MVSTMTAETGTRQQEDPFQRDQLAARRMRPGLSSWRRARRKFRRNRLAVAALGASLALAIVAFGAPLVSRYVTGVEPNKQNLLHNFESISGEHWLGTDEYGRDVLTRLVYGARVSLGVAILATVVTIVVGTLAGATAAYYGGWVDQVLMRFVDVMLAIPPIYLLLLLGALFAVGPVQLAVLIALIGWYPLARLVRAEMLSLRGREFVDAARVIGAPGRTIVARHLLPNVLHLVIVFATGAVPGYLLLEAALSFLGLGVRPPTPSLGSMLIGSTQYLYKRPALIFFPGLTIAAIALAVSIVGNALRDALDPRLDT